MKSESTVLVMRNGSGKSGNQNVLFWIASIDVFWHPITQFVLLGNCHILHFLCNREMVMSDVSILSRRGFIYWAAFTSLPKSQERFGNNYSDNMVRKQGATFEQAIYFSLSKQLLLRFFLSPKRMLLPIKCFLCVFSKACFVFSYWTVVERNGAWRLFTFANWRRLYDGMWCGFGRRHVCRRRVHVDRRINPNHQGLFS